MSNYDWYMIKLQIKRFISENKGNSHFPESRESVVFMDMFSTYKPILESYINENKVKKNIGYFLSNMLNNHGVTASELADSIFIDRGNFSNMINSKRTISKDTCVKICIALNLDKNEANELFQITNNQFDNNSTRDLIMEFMVKNTDIFAEFNPIDKRDKVNSFFKPFDQKPLFNVGSDN